MASNPVANTIAVELVDLLGRADAGRGDLHRSASCAMSTSDDVGAVVRLEVVGVEADALGADRVAGGAQRLGHLGILDDRRGSSVADELGRRVVGPLVW